MDLSPTHTESPARPLLSMTILADIFFIFSALIYFPFLGRTAETQPIIAALLAILVVAIELYKGARTLYLSQYVLAFLAFVAFTVFHGLFIGSDTAFEQFPRYLLGPLFFIAALFFSPFATVNVLRVGLMFFALSGFIELFASPLYIALNEFLSAGRYHGAPLSLRGLSYFSPEPSYSALSLFFFISLTYMFWRSGRIGRRSMLFYAAAFMVLMLLTFSSYAVMLILIMMAAYVLRANPLIGVATVAAGILLILGILQTESRAGQLLSNIANIRFDDIVATFILVEASASARLLQFVVSIYGLYSNPLGFGIGGFQSVYWQHFIDLDWGWIQYHGIMGEAFMNREPLQPGAFFPIMFHDLGIFGVAAFTAFVIHIRRAFGTTPLEAGFFLAAFFMLFVQAQLTNPAPWVILACLFALNRSEVRAIR